MFTEYTQTEFYTILEFGLRKNFRTNLKTPKKTSEVNKFLRLICLIEKVKLKC